MGELTAQVRISELSNCKSWYEIERVCGIESHELPTSLSCARSMQTKCAKSVAHLQRLRGKPHARRSALRHRVAAGLRAGSDSGRTGRGVIRL